MSISFIPILAHEHFSNLCIGQQYPNFSNFKHNWQSVICIKDQTQILCFALGCWKSTTPITSSMLVHITRSSAWLRGRNWCFYKTRSHRWQWYEPHAFPMCE